MRKEKYIYRRNYGEEIDYKFEMICKENKRQGRKKKDKEEKKERKRENKKKKEVKIRI